MQNKITMKYYTPTRIAIIKNKDNEYCWIEYKMVSYCGK